MSSPRSIRPLLLTLLAAALATVFTPRTAVGQAGRGCSAFNPCPNGYSCQPFVQKCYHSPRRENEPCSAGFGCGKGLRCAPGVQKCVKQDAAPVGIIEKGVGTVTTGVKDVAKSMSCPDMQMKCPTGQSFARGTSWDGGRAMCRPSNAMSTTLANKCPQPYAGTSLATKWNSQASQSVACSAKKELVGVNFDLQAPYSELFNDACIIHDLCYRSSQQRSSCDDQFLENLRAVCYKLDVLMVATAGITVAGCVTTANIGYAAVRGEGQDSYDDDQKEFGYPATGGVAPGSSTSGTTTTGPTNVSLGKRAQQSGTDFGGAASRAVDGNTNGNFAGGSVTHTTLMNGAWWMVDLGSTHFIENVTVYNRTDCCQERLNADVVVTNTAGWPSNSIVFKGSLGTPQAVMSLAVSAQGRYVYIVNRGTNYLSLAEVVVTGRSR